VHTLQYWQHSLTQHTLKCVDSETGEIVGMALWDIYITPSDWRKGEIAWLHGKERERAEALVGPLWGAREKMWSNERYLYCHVIAVHPNFQRRGIGELLVEYGKKVALQATLPIYVESSRDAIRLYEKSGFRWLKERPIHKSSDLWPERPNGNQRDCEIPLLVWIPGDEKRLLPEAVELA
jgi:ribosomal protein S18 acetylase RimI-like enzyme